MNYDSNVGRVVHLTEERKRHISRFHPDLKHYVGKIRTVLATPDEIRRSRYDPAVVILYKFYARIKGGKYLAVVVKLNVRSFVLTAYLTGKIAANYT